MLGKDVRMERIINRNSGRTIIVPMDHGVSAGPIEGLINMKDAAQMIQSLLNLFVKKELYNVQMDKE